MRVFVRVFLHEFFFAWTLSCVRVLVCVFSCVFYARVLFCVDAFLYDLFFLRVFVPGDDDLKNDGETSEDQADDQTSMNLHDDHINKTTID